jgi:hypothetical protein
METNVEVEIVKRIVNWRDLEVVDCARPTQQWKRLDNQLVGLIWWVCWDQHSYDLNQLHRYGQERHVTLVEP